MPLLSATAIFACGDLSASVTCDTSVKRAVAAQAPTTLNEDQSPQILLHCEAKPDNAVAHEQHGVVGMCVGTGVLMLQPSVNEP